MRVLSEWRRLIMAVLLGVVCLAGPLVAGETTAAAGEVGFFQKIKNNINSWLADDSGKIKKDVSKTVGKIEKSTKKNVKKIFSRGQSGGRKVLSYVKKKARKASDNIQKSIAKDKKTLRRKFQTSSD